MDNAGMRRREALGIARLEEGSVQTDAALALGAVVVLAGIGGLLYKNERDLERFTNPEVREIARRLQNIDVWLRTTTEWEGNDTRHGDVTEREGLAAYRHSKGSFVPVPGYDLPRGSSISWNFELKKRDHTVDYPDDGRVVGVDIVWAPRLVSLQNLGPLLVFHKLKTEVREHTRERVGWEVKSKTMVVSSRHFVQPR